jgi:hypothetical protein
MKEGEPDCLVGIQFVVSPKAGFVREARELAEACAALVPRLRPSEELSFPDHLYTTAVQGRLIS